VRAALVAAARHGRRRPARRVRRLALPLVLAAAALTPAAASAHPLGNLSVNHLAEVRVSADQVDVRYLLDQAEIPTFQERRRGDGAVLARKRAEAVRGLELRVDGRRAALVAAGPGRLTHRPGAGGLPTTRVELDLRADVAGPRRVVLRDDTFAGRIGYRAVVVRPGTGTAVRSSVPATDPTGGLRRYPKGALDRPLDVRTATLAVRPGPGTVDAPGAHGPSGSARAASGFERILDGDGLLVVLLLAAFGWGAVHALSPGHGKAMVAAYLIGTRGTVRDALALGGIVTVTHTAGVFALGLVTLGLSQFVLPQDLFPWINLVAGLLVLGVGVGLVRARRRARAGTAHGGAGHAHDHHHGHDHHHHYGHDHHHGHDHGDLSRRGLLAMGASAGLVPCPSALVVLLAAISQHRLALGLALIVAFSAGLAATLSGLGVAVVKATGRLATIGRGGRLAAALPAVSALAITGVGGILTLKAVGQLPL